MVDKFIEAMGRYQGYESKRVPSELLYKLDKYFNDGKFPDTRIIRNLPLNPDGTRGDTNRKMLLVALREFKYYEDVIYIGIALWNWEPPSLNEKIIAHYWKMF